MINYYYGNMERKEEDNNPHINEKVVPKNIVNPFGKLMELLDIVLEDITDLTATSIEGGLSFRERTRLEEHKVLMNDLTTLLTILKQR